MYTKSILGLLLLLGVMFVGIAVAKEGTKDCCAAKMACCTPASACCAASAKLGCCEKGMKCCEEKRACCNAPQKCCVEGSACCEQSKACCGAAKHHSQAANTDAQTAIRCEDGAVCKVDSTSTAATKNGSGKSCCNKGAKSASNTATDVTIVTPPRS